MEKQTIILRITASIDFSNEALVWMDGIADNHNETQLSNLWFIREHGKYLLTEYQSVFGQMLVEEIDSEIQPYFLERGVNEEYLPTARVVETYIGSLTIATVITIGLALGKTYEVIKGISEVPDMVEGLTKLKDSIADKFKRKANKKTHDLLEEQTVKNKLPSPPVQAIVLKDFVIDARPLAALKPSEMKSHSIHLSAGVSQESFTLENLGTDVMRDIQIGLFISEAKRHQWSFADAYISSVPLLSSKQTISKPLEDFFHNSFGKLEIKKVPAHIDCWVQDSFGIYLFNFYLDK